MSALELRPAGHGHADDPAATRACAALYWEASVDALRAYHVASRLAPEPDQRTLTRWLDLNRAADALANLWAQATPEHTIEHGLRDIETGWSKYGDKRDAMWFALVVADVRARLRGEDPPIPEMKEEVET